MKYKLVAIITLAFFSLEVAAQQFISKGVIEFEVITNVKKTMGNSSFWEQ